MLGFLRHPNLHRGFPARPERPGRRPAPALGPRLGVGTVVGSGGRPGRDRRAVLAPAGGGGGDAGGGGGTGGGKDTGAVAAVFVNERYRLDSRGGAALRAGNALQHISTLAIFADAESP